MNCPNCQFELLPSFYGLEKWEDGNNVTLNCTQCQFLLIIINDLIENFNYHLYYQEPIWSDDIKI